MRLGGDTGLSAATDHLPGEAELLLAAVGLTTVGLLAALVVAGGSGLVSGVGRRRRLREAPPSRGDVPEERHRHVESAAAR